MKKKTRILALFLVCVLIVATSISFVSAAERRYYSYGTVSVSAANLRSNPEINDTNIIGLLSKGDCVRILQGVTGDGLDWYRVLVSTGANANRTGYVSTGCITVEGITP